jgi:hypothetical protein
MKKPGANSRKKLIITVLSTFILVTSIFLFSNILEVFQAHADEVSTSVTVGNGAPSITAGPAENPASTTASPTNVGSNVTFEATASDPNSEDYYLIICSTNEVSATNGGAPTCTATTWCTSTATTSATQASCSYTTQATDSTSNAWYAFVCDGNSSAAACSATGAQGTGDSGSPFETNHAPSFSSPSNDGPVNPGSTVTWSTTSSDSDSDNVKLIVCKTAGITADACDGGAGDTWCSSSLVASNASCGYAVPSVYPDDTYSAYVYIVDTHNFGSTDTAQGTDVSFTVNNVAPTVSAVTINGGSAITLTESTTKAVTLTATVSDNNSCAGGELATIYGYAYRSSITYTGCDTSGEANNNFCYPEVTCTYVTDTCSGTTDASADYTCTVNIYYYADPTDANTEFPDDTWLSTVKAIDDDAASGNTEVSTGVELESLTAASITNAIDYAGLSVEGSIDPLSKTTTTTPTGNVGLDQELSGSANMCTDYPTCSVGTPIGVAYQKYALVASTAYSSGTALSTSAVETELNVPKAESGSPTGGTTYWGIYIPTGTLAGVYSGANVLTAVKGEIANW